MNNFPTLGAAVLYLNGFHHGEHIACLNGLARTEPKWVMRVANIVWDNRDKGYTPTFHEHAWLLGFGVKDYNTQA